MVEDLPSGDWAYTCDMEACLIFAQIANELQEKELAAIYGIIGSTLVENSLDNFSEALKGVSQNLRITREGYPDFNDGMNRDKLAFCALLFLYNFERMKTFLVNCTDVYDKDKIPLFAYMCEMRNYLLLHPKFYEKLYFIS